MNATPRAAGTTYDAKRGKWKAQLRIGGKLTALGYHATQDEAASAVAAAREKHGAAAPERRQKQRPLSTSDQALVQHNQRKRLVYQSNDLVEEILAHHHKHNETEFRLFMRMLQCLHQHDEELGRILIPVYSFANTEGGAYVAEVEAACLSIATRVLRLRAQDGEQESFLLQPLVQELGYEHSTRMVVGTFNPKLHHHLVKLASRFTRADVETLMTLEGVHAQRGFWLFKKWSGLYRGSPHTVSVDELRNLTCGVGKYPSYGEYKRLVLNPFIAQLLSKGFTITYAENKQAATVISLVFKVSHVDDVQPAKAEVAVVTQKSVQQVQLRPTTPVPPATPLAGLVNAALGGHIGPAQQPETELVEKLLNKLAEYQFNLRQLAAVKLYLTEHPANAKMCKERRENIQLEINKLNEEKSNKAAAVLWSNILKERPYVKRLFEASQSSQV